MFKCYSMTTTHPVAINKQYQSNSHHHAYMAAYITKALYKHQLTLSIMLPSVITPVSEMKQQREAQRFAQDCTAREERSSRVEGFQIGVSLQSCGRLCPCLWVEHHLCGLADGAKKEIFTLHLFLVLENVPQTERLQHMGLYLCM